LNRVFIRAILLANRLNEDQPEELQIKNCIDIAKAIALTGIVTPELVTNEEIGKIADDVNRYVDKVRAQQEKDRALFAMEREL